MGKGLNNVSGERPDDACIDEILLRMKGSFVKEGAVGAYFL